MSNKEHKEPNLEAECRNARAKAKDVCVWVLHDYILTVGCTGLETRWFGYSFCPYCGKKIEVVK